MKKFISICLFLSIIMMVGCTPSEKEQHNDKQKEKQETQKKTTKKIPKQKGIPAILLGNVSFDSSYDTVCWGNCKKEGFYDFPNVQEGEVKEGEKIRISWENLQPKPSKIVLLNITTGQEKELKVDDLLYDMPVYSENNHQQFSVQFYWIEGKEMLGNTTLNFKLNVKKNA